MKIYGIPAYNSSIGQQPKGDVSFGLIREDDPNYRRTKKILNDICGADGGSNSYFNALKNNKGVTFYPSNSVLCGKLNRDYVNSSAGRHWYEDLEEEGRLKSIDSEQKLEHLLVTLMYADGEEIIDAENKRPKSGDPPILREKYWKTQGKEITARLRTFGIGAKTGVFATARNALEVADYKNTVGMRLHVENNKLKCMSELQYRSLNWLEYPNYVKKAQKIEKYLKEIDNMPANKNELEKAKHMFKEAAKTLKDERPEPPQRHDLSDSVAWDRG